MEVHTLTTPALGNVNVGRKRGENNIVLAPYRLSESCEVLGNIVPAVSKFRCEILVLADLHDNCTRLT